MSLPVPQPEPARTSARLRAGLFLWLPLAAALLYAFGHLDWYMSTPLGRVPVLDEHENIDLAEAIFGGTLPHEPFYRAPGYALVLAGLRVLGVPSASLFASALVLGAVLHGAAAALAAAVAGRLFGKTAGLVAGLLYALDPVLVHYATQALDAALSLTLFLAGLYCLVGAVRGPGRLRPWTLASLFWAAAAVTRPNYLFAWLLVPACALAAALPVRRRSRAIAAALSGLLLFAGVSFWQYEICGVPGFLPWQGAYNLWSANRPGANGRFYTQQVSLPAELARLNPAKAESVLLYEKDSGGKPPLISAMDAFWRGRFWDEVLHHPLRWAKLMARKLYALANNFEQYNNKTYAFHKARSPWLRWNPLCWGLVLVLAVAGAARLAHEFPRDWMVLLAVKVACVLSVVLFFVSARFRLPLAALCLVLAGGALEKPGFWTAFSPRKQALLAAAMIFAAVTTFSRLGGVASTATFVQDHALLARAAYAVGDDRTALAEANEALKLQPWHPDALAVARAAQAEMDDKAAEPEVRASPR